MCLYPIHRTVKTAKVDIVCYKVLEQKMVSPFKQFKYKLNKLYISATPKIVKFPYIRIEEGFHAFTKYIHARACPVLYYYSDIYECIIPKGSKYYLGKHYDIVSDQIIIKEKIEL